MWIVTPCALASARTALIWWLAHRREPPGPVVLGVASEGLCERLGDHLLGVFYDARGEPLRLGLGGGWLGAVLAGAQDVGRCANYGATS